MIVVVGYEARPSMYRLRSCGNRSGWWGWCSDVGILVLVLATGIPCLATICYPLTPTSGIAVTSVTML